MTLAGGFDAAGIVLAGGRSSRMGTSKASLGWHGSTLLRRVADVVGRVVNGPVVVVRAAGQALPGLPRGTEVVEDVLSGKGPLAGLATGLATVRDRCQVTYVSAADVPFLHPAFVARVLAGCSAGLDICVPVVGGRSHPLAAAYRPSVLEEAEALLGADRLRVAELFECCSSRRVEEAWLLADPGLAAADPGLHSVHNVNLPADYELALACRQPEVLVGGQIAVWACTLGGAAAAAGVDLGQCAGAVLNGREVGTDPELALVAGDTVSFVGPVRCDGPRGNARRERSLP